MSLKKIFTVIFILILCLTGGILRADDTDEEALFTNSVAPDALLLLDLSGSMDDNPNGTSYIYGSSTSCIADTTNCKGTNCSNGFCSSTKTSCSTDCRKLTIAKRAIFSILDDTGDNVINADDEASLAVRIGYMRFYNGDDQSGNYSSGNNHLTKAINQSYSSIFCNTTKASGCTISSTCSSSCSTSTNCINSECANGGTPLAAALNEAKLYLDYHKSQDNAKACRQKFVILLSDGADTYACSGDGTETQSTQYKRRRESVAKAKALADAGYGLFVIGFGSGMPTYLQNTLNWMAYFGGTDNPLDANVGNTSAYNPAAVTSCGASSTTGTCPECYATTNDPGNLALSGYAFIATNADEIAAQLKAAFDIIREANYSFTQASVQLNRTVDENYIYEGSIDPVAREPFWLGHLKKYQINTDGTKGAGLWDAGAVLAGTSASSRNIKTYLSGTSLIDFNTTNISATNLGVTTSTQQSLIIGFFRGESTYNIEGWKLGDIFRSKPITVGTPSYFFEDIRDTNNAFASFRSGHIRNSNPYSGRIVLVGANDGQVHAFRTSDGTEAWSFIPPSLLTRLQLIAHNTHPTSLTHQSYVDGPVTVADAWVPSSSSSGTSKNVSDWQTHLLFGLGQGAGSNLWSSSSTCSAGFNQTYTSTYPYYCGYYCLNVTNPLAPSLCGAGGSPNWLRLSVTAAAAPYLGAPWSAPMVGRVKIGGLEKWVVFIGGGYTSPGAANSGKGLFVFNMTDGTLLWSYTKANNSSLDNTMPAPPTIVDTDNDGFMDMVYLGDTASNMWRFKLCRAADGDSCTTSNWTGSLFYDASTSVLRPVYTAATAAKDPYNNLWIYWGTGNKLDPTATETAQEKLFALKDTDFTSTWRLNDMQDISSAGSTCSGTAQGWYINLTGSGEKMLAEPTVFGGVVYFTTYTPPAGNDPCVQGGTASIHGINYTTCAGALNLGGATPVRSTTIGVGIPSAPIVSMRPGSDATPDLYVTTSGGGGISADTFRVNFDPRGMANRTNLIYWKDKRLE